MVNVRAFRSHSRSFYRTISPFIREVQGLNPGSIPGLEHNFKYRASTPLSLLNDRHHERVRERPIPYNRERGNPAPLTKTLSTARNTTPTRDLPRDASLRAQEMLESRTRTEKWPSTNRVVREELLVLFKRAEHRLFIFFN